MAAGAAALALTACGNISAGYDTSNVSRAAPAATTASAQPSSDFDSADVMFVQMMIPHHQQAIEMAGLAETRASHKEVKQLAAKIKGEQQPEINTMESWLRAWGKPAPSGGMGHSMPGMMPEADMKKLEKARGAAFDRTFLKMMIAHHKGAIEMARTEQEHGANPQAKQLAKNIESSQRAEVKQMQKMLDRL